MSVRLRLTLSYAGFLVFAGALMLAAVWVFSYVPDAAITAVGRFVPDFLRDPGLRAAAALAFLLVFGLLGGWFLAGRMLAPLARITAATRRAANGSLSHRIDMEGRQDEFRELADSFDAMLARLEAHVAAQQRFAANASHELRTPLAVTKSLLEIARSDPTVDADELVDRLRAVNRRAIDLTEALLVLSRADQRSFTRERVDLSLIAEEAAETLLPLAESRGVAMHVSGDIAPTSGSFALLLQLTTNLLHNAIVHNLPRGGVVNVHTTARQRFVVLSVENSGEALPEDALATLTEPFQRGAVRVRGDDAGVGLGLAIVQSITQAHDGILTLRARPGGGLHVSVQLPDLPPQASSADRQPTDERPPAVTAVPARGAGVPARLSAGRRART